MSASRADRPVRRTYFSRHVGEYPDQLSLVGKQYQKVEDLRYGTNPHQTAAFYRPRDGDLGVLGSMRLLKTGKSGLSQTNVEDIAYAMNILKYFQKPGAVVMKHLNPSGAAMQRGEEPLREIYLKARDCDSRAFFGGIVGSNTQVDVPTAEEIMSTYIEIVAAPCFAPGALSVFQDYQRFKMNQHIRIVEVPNIDRLPKFVGDETRGMKQIRTLVDGTVIVSDPLLTQVRAADGFISAEVDSKRKGHVKSETVPTETQKEDILFAWWVLLSVRSNPAIIAKNKSTLGIGTGEQDRVGAVEQAIDKYHRKYKGKETIEGSVMVTDGYFPFPDAVEIAADVGIRAIAMPGGSVKDYEVIQAANERGLAILFAPERCFSHH